MKVYPSRTVEAGAIVTQSIIQERHAHRYLFGSRGVAGLVNIGVTPQVAVRLGMAYGTTFKRGTTVVTGRDASRAARALKRALIAGLNSTGVNCQDQELTPLPLTRFTVRTEGAAGGISVRTSPGNPEEVEIRFFDPQGRDLPTGSQRKIERTFFREEYRRPGPHRLGELGFPAHAVEQYASGLLRAIDGEKIRAGEPKVVVDYAFGLASLIAPAILGRLGCEVLALNAFADEHRPSLTQEDLRDMLSRLAEHVRTSGSDVGVLLEPGGETAHLVDDAGRVVSPDKALLAFIRHEAARGTDRVAVPVSCSSACEKVAEEAGATLQWSPVSLAGLMDRAARAGVGLAGNAEGALIFPRFMPAPDGLMTFFKALELLAVSGRRLSEIVDGLPPVHMARRDVPTPWQQKGAVMREVASSAGPSRLMLLDGVKVIEKDRWALVIPLADEPVCRIWTEASSPQGAEALADRYADVRRVGRASALVDLSTSK